jgi:hypothetical protein
MFKACTQKYTDESDEATFRFSFCCDLCGERFRATPVRFTGGNPPPDTSDAKTLWKMLWRREHGRAFERANFEARYHFYACPGCGRFVCDKCTVVKPEADGGSRRERCVQCSRRAREGFRPHLRYVAEPGTALEAAALPDEPVQPKNQYS